jgi:hypothetical protein
MFMNSDRNIDTITIAFICNRASVPYEIDSICHILRKWMVANSVNVLDAISTNINKR